MPLQYKNTFLEYVPAVPELKRSKTSPDLMFTLEIKQKHALDRVDSDAETEYRSSESSGGDSPAPTSQRKHLTGPLWADMTDEEDDEVVVVVETAAAEVAVVETAAAEKPKASWADMSDDEEEVQEAKAPAPVEDDGWTTVVTKKGKKGRR